MDENLDALVELGDRVVGTARAAGVDVAEAVVRTGSHLSAKTRLGEPELVEEAGNRSVGLRVMLDRRVAVTFTSDLSVSGLDRLVADAVELAKLTEPDEYAGPPPEHALSTSAEHSELDLHDAEVAEVEAATALRRASESEAAARAHDARITNSEGSTFARVEGARAIVTSGGFRGVTKGTYASLTTHPVADDTDDKKRSGYYWSARRHLADLLTPSAVGQEAARRTIAKLGARKVPTQEVPVVFDPDAGRSILGLLAGCVSGGAIWRRASYLLDRVGTEVASPLVTVIDDPLLQRGPGSRAFDGEGLLSRQNTVVQAGVLNTYLLDTYSARKLGLESTANASRGASGGVGVSTTNFLLQPGDVTREALIADTQAGLYVTDMMGFGFNSVTGDFSRGATGFWIERGELSFPVSEITISLNLDQLLKRIDLVADDLDTRTAVATPTFRVSAMTVAGH